MAVSGKLLLLFFECFFGQPLRVASLCNVVSDIIKDWDSMLYHLGLENYQHTCNVLHGVSVDVLLQVQLFQLKRTPEVLQSVQDELYVIISFVGRHL